MKDSSQYNPASYPGQIPAKSVRWLWRVLAAFVIAAFLGLSSDWASFALATPIHQSTPTSTPAPVATRRNSLPPTNDRLDPVDDLLEQAEVAIAAEEYSTATKQIRRAIGDCGFQQRLRRHDQAACSSGGSPGVERQS